MQIPESLRSSCHRHAGIRPVAALAPVVLTAIAVAAAAPSLVAQALAPRTAPEQARPENRYGFPIWHEDFPGTIDFPTSGPRGHYDRTRRQALEAVVAHLQGNVRREVWLMATEFFARAPDDAIEPLITAMDRAFSQGPKDLAKNVIEAMGKMGREEFDSALRRALEHQDSAIRQAAYAALGHSGSAETVRSTFRYFMHMDGRARASWLRAARVRLGADAVPMFAKLMVPETVGPVRDQVLKEALEMPPEQGAEVLRGLWPEAVGDFKAIIAGVFHAAKIVSGTAWLHDALRSEDPLLVAKALQSVARGGVRELREDVLRLSTHPNPEVRLALARTLTQETGEDIENTYEVLAQPDEMFETKAIALRELTRRGRTESVAALIDEVATATGTRLRVQLDLLGASGDARGVGVFRERFERAPETEGRQYLRALAFCGAEGSAEALLELFTGPERAVEPPGKDGSQLTTLNYIPILLPNLRGKESELIGAFSRLPREDHRRRSLMLQSLISISADRNDPAIKSAVDGILRSVLFDQKEIPQLRLQALSAMTMKTLTIDDAMQLKRQQSKEEQPMRLFFEDFLHEYF